MYWDWRAEGQAREQERMEPEEPERARADWQSPRISGAERKRYCGALVMERKTSLRRAATAEAALHLGVIVADGSARITKAIFQASVDKVSGVLTSASNFAKEAGAKVVASVWWSRTEEQPEAAG